MKKSKVIYILTNPVMPGLVKIGMADNLEKRVKILSSNSGVPIPFEVHYACELKPDLKPDRVEKGLHGAFGDHRVNQRREFFRIAPERVVAILETMELKNVTPNSDSYVEDQEEKKSLDRERKRRASFSFVSVDIPEGSVISFVRDETVTATVAKNDPNVEFEGEETSLSKSAWKILKRDHGWKSPRLAGTLYWVYDNETLAERRLRYESEE